MSKNTPQRLILGGKINESELVLFLKNELHLEIPPTTGLSAHPDVFFAPDDGQNLKIGSKEAKTGEEMLPTSRNMLMWASKRPITGQKKVLVVQNATRFGIPAINALLKLIEEPPEYLFFVFTAENPFALLQTIRSRMVIRFLPVKTPEITENPFFEAQNLHERLKLIESWDKTAPKDAKRHFYIQKIQEILNFARFKAHLALPHVSKALIMLKKNTNVRFTAEWLAVQLQKEKL